MPTADVFTGPGGSDPVGYAVKLQDAIQPTVGDVLYAGQIFRTSMVQRTMQGTDVNGVPFAPYSAGYVRQKTRALGSASPVNLFGAGRHVHMLNEIQVRAGGAVLTQSEQANTDPYAYGEHTAAFYVGIWEPEAAMRARVHNEGESVPTRLGKGKRPDVSFGHGVMRQKRGGKATAQMPVRRFFAANQGELDLIAFALAERRDLRLKALGLRKA